jgi:serine protease Do
MRRFLSYIMLFELLVFSQHTLMAAEVPQELKSRQEQLLSSVDRVRKAVVGVSDGIGVGSGVIISGDGIVLTASHVVEGRGRGFRGRRGPDRPITVLFPDGTQYAATLLGKNADADAAVLKISEPPREGTEFPHADMGKTTNTQPGQWCFALGHPGGYRTDRQAPLRFGRVLSVGSRTVVSDCAILLGDSGGPLFDMEGRVIGIHSMITSLIIENRHVAIDAFHHDWERLMAGERWGKLRSSDNDAIETGIFGIRVAWRDFIPVVDDVIDGTPAKAAGIQKGDVLLGIGAGRIADRLDLSTIIDLLEEDQQVDVRIRRGSEELALKLTTGDLMTTDSADSSEGASGGSARRDSIREEQREKEIMEQLSDNRRIGPNEKRAPEALQQFNPVAEEHRNGVVAIRDGGPLLCLGTVVSSDGYILTKASELNDALRPEVVFPKGGRFPAKEVARDVSFDLALLKVDGRELQPLEFRPTPAQVGELALLQDPRGRPAIPTVVSVEAHSMENSNRAFLGIKPRTDLNGVRIAQIIPGGAAERNGLKENDVILSIAGQDLQSAEELMERVLSFKPGDKVAVRYMRGEKIESLELVLTARFTNENPLLPLYDVLDSPQMQFASVHAGGFPRVLQIDADVYPSKVGGPLLDLEGRSLGIVIARADRYPTYVIPADSVQEVFQRLKAEAEAKAAQSAAAAEGAASAVETQEPATSSVQ